jgi:hypothetical protein
MGCDVFANGDEIACKAGDGKVIAAFPDVCLTPPPPPAGPIPVPYPDTSFSKDMKEGSKTVKIQGQEVMLKDISYYKSSPLGDEAATNGQGAGVVTHVITGKTYFVSWSMDVLFEGQNVDRHTDMTTSNHASPMANAQVPMVNFASMEFAVALAEQGVCPCCHETAHSRGPIITEAQYYGTEDIIFHDSAGTIQVLDSHPNAANLLQQVRSGPCKDLLPPPEGGPCAVYRVTTPAESQNIAAEWREARLSSLDAGRPLGGAPGQATGHRVPKNAGGCPDGGGNLTPVKPGCEETEERLAQHHAQRIEALRPLLGLT